MKAIWTTMDRNGRSVTLTEEAWLHIVREHDDMPGREGEVRAAVEAPEFVQHKLRLDYRENHYRRPATDAPWTKVVVAYDLDPKEVQLWP